ncbi:MAG: cell division protein ZapA [Burkholderiaceae bacterium]
MAKASPATKPEQAEELNVVILNREFTLAVAPSERSQLEKAVEMVDQKMRAVRDTGKISGVDKIAIMAALQIANDLVKAGPAKRSSAANATANAAPAEGASTEGAVGADTMKKVRKLNDRLETELKKQEDLF